MTENIPALQEELSNVEQHFLTGEAELRKAVDSWRAHFGAAVEPAMFAQARRYFEVFPMEANSLDAAGVTRLKGNVQGAAVTVAKETTEQITFEAVVSGTLLVLRQRLLILVADAMEDVLRPTFVWAGWLVTGQQDPKRSADFEDSEEFAAYRTIGRAAQQLENRRSILKVLRERLDRAEALALWDSSQDR